MGTFVPLHKHIELSTFPEGLMIAEESLIIYLHAISECSMHGVYEMISPNEQAISWGSVTCNCFSLQTLNATICAYILYKLDSKIWNDVNNSTIAHYMPFLLRMMAQRTTNKMWNANVNIPSTHKYCISFTCWYCYHRYSHSPFTKGSKNEKDIGIFESDDVGKKGYLAFNISVFRKHNDNTMV